jgi:hypothetical protein
MGQRSERKYPAHIFTPNFLKIRCNSSLHLQLVLPSSLFPSPNIMYAFFVSPLPWTCIHFLYNPNGTQSRDAEMEWYPATSCDFGNLCCLEQCCMQLTGRVTKAVFRSFRTPKVALGVKSNIRNKEYGT